MPARSRRVTDAAGRFEVRNLPAGSFDLDVRAKGFAPLTVPALAVPEGTGASDLGTVVLAPGAAIHGVVVDAQGEPVADAEVLARGADRDGISIVAARGRAPGVFTAADGSFVLDGPRAGADARPGRHPSGLRAGRGAGRRRPRPVAAPHRPARRPPASPGG